MSERPIEDVLRSLVDATGFAFQLGIEELVKRAGSGYQVLLSEHAWRHPHNGTSGFIDAVLENLHTRFVLECKRVRESRWVFLLPLHREPDTGETVQQVDLFWTAVSSERGVLGGRDTVWCEPESPQSQFCIVPGAADHQKPMLERLAGTLLEATDALAAEERQIEQRQMDAQRGQRLRGTDWSFYIPVIVTMADLFVCTFDANNVAVTDGLLPPGAQFRPVPFVRFYKNLSTDPPWNACDTLKEASRGKNRTVFVVNGAELPFFLRRFKWTSGIPAGLQPFMPQPSHRT